ncbi:hypothetical protein BDQ17DRAFT_1337088 [Cyathus striatus]|nr:hypothetical protein BDQ17DRAFT_1337088 [Cyathus striatus]
MSGQTLFNLLQIHLPLLIPSTQHLRFEYVAYECVGGAVGSFTIHNRLTGGSTPSWIDHADFGERAAGEGYTSGKALPEVSEIYAAWGRIVPRLTYEFGVLWFGFSLLPLVRQFMNGMCWAMPLAKVDGNSQSGIENGG